MRLTAFALLAAWCAPAAADRLVADELCPVSRVKLKAPAITQARNEQAAITSLVKRGSMPEGVDGVIGPAQKSDAYAVGVRRGWAHESSTSYWDHHALFVLAKNVIVAHRLADWTEVIPPACGRSVRSAIIGVRIIKTTRKTYGLARVRRAVATASTLPAVKATSTSDPECSTTTNYRVEDHVFDLDRRRELLVLAAGYEGPVYEEHADPALPFDKVQVTDQGVTVDDRRCKAFGWRP